MKLLDQAAAFGGHLIGTLDLDPIYPTIVGARLTEPVLARLLVAYWCLYHLGAAAVIAERGSTPERFWKLLGDAARNKESLPERRWPRSSERRHWRGEQAVRSVQSLYDATPGHRPESLLTRWGEGRTFTEVNRRVQLVRGFGPWISFKVADMLERVVGYEIDFQDCQLGFYAEPAKGAWLIKEGAVPTPMPPAALTTQTIQEVCDSLRIALGSTTPPKYFRHAPPWNKGRAINIQELETVLCKFKSFHKGHYWVGKDILEVKHALTWGTAQRCDLAEELARHVPKEVKA